MLNHWVHVCCHILTTAWGWYHGGRRPSSDDSFKSPTVIPHTALDKPSIMKCYHRRWTRWGVTARSSTMVTLHDTGFVECQWWNDGFYCENCRHLTVISLHDTGPWSADSCTTDAGLKPTPPSPPPLLSLRLLEQQKLSALGEGGGGGGCLGFPFCVSCVLPSSGARCLETF